MLTPHMIYCVTYFERTKRPDGPCSGGQRTWAWFREQAAAERFILENRTDGFEGGFYEYAVIESVPEGFGLAQAICWFRSKVTADHEDITIERCDPPEWSRNMVNWAMG